jgi:hypothetical protein
MLDTEEKVRAGKNRAQGHFDAGFELARRFALPIELCQHLHFGSGHGTPERTPRQSGNHLLCAAVFIGWLLRAAGEDAPPAGCVARTGRIERSGDRDRMERGLDTRMTIHVEARQVGLAFGLNQRRRPLEKRCVEHVRPRLDGSSHVKIAVHGFVFLGAGRRLQGEQLHTLAIDADFEPARFGESLNALIPVSRQPELDSYSPSAGNE